MVTTTVITVGQAQSSKSKCRLPRYDSQSKSRFISCVPAVDGANFQFSLHAHFTRCHHHHHGSAEDDRDAAVSHQ